MKKLLIITGIFFLHTIILFPQLSGNGTIGNPYAGTLNDNTVWYPDSYTNGTIYALNIIIPSGLTLTVSPGLYNGGHVQFTSTNTLTIQANGTFIVNPQTSVTVHSILNSGTLRLESNSNEAGVASLLHRLYSGTGNVETRLYLSGGTTAGDAFKWHYISMPFSGVTATSFSTLNLAQYIENLVTSDDNYPGWVAYDGYQYSSGSTLSNTFATLSLGSGYNYYSASSTTFTFTENLNISDVEVQVTCGTGYTDFQGYNLIGNPFASCIDWDYIVDNFNPAFVADAIYFTNNGSIASYVSGVGSNGGTGTIPPMQGFFVKASANSSVYLPTEARTHYLDQLRYKKKSTEETSTSIDTISLVRLKLEGVSDSTDLVVRFNNIATVNVDMTFDAYEFSKTAGDINIWTTTGGVFYSINGLPFPETSVEIPVGVNMKVPGTFRLSSNEIKKLDIYNISLKDLSTNQTADLKKGEFIEFTSAAGMIEDRFILVVTKSSTNITDLHDPGKMFSIYSTPGRTINIRSLTDDTDITTGSVAIYDINGRKVLQEGNIEWAGNGDLKQIVMKQGGTGLYLVVVTTSNGKYVEKVTLR